jgi:hypothetical protein
MAGAGGSHKDNRVVWYKAGTSLAGQDTGLILCQRSDQQIQIQHGDERSGNPGLM